jgi:soluble cytochrome b562
MCRTTLCTTFHSNIHHDDEAGAGQSTAPINSEIRPMRSTTPMPESEEVVEVEPERVVQIGMTTLVSSLDNNEMASLQTWVDHIQRALTQSSEIRNRSS